MKKKLESKLAQGVRQVKSQTKPQVQSPQEQEPEVVSVSTETPSTPQPPVANPIRRADDLHPQRVWPD